MEQALNAYGAFHDPAVPSLAETLARFMELPGETDSRKTRARAAVATLCRLLKKETAAEIPAQPNFLMHQLTRLKHGPTVLNAKSIANCKSEIRYLMDKVGGHSGRSRFRPLSVEWLALRNAFGEEPLLWKLSRLMAFCSTHNILPQAVDDATIESFRAELCKSAEVAKPEQKVRDAITAWNKLSAMAVDMALPTLSVPEKLVPGWTIAPEKFPTPLQADVAAWQLKYSHIDPDAEEGPITASAPKTLKLYRHHVFKAASALVLSGCAIESITSLGCLVEIETFKTIMKYLRARQGGEKTVALFGLARTLISVARNHENLGGAHIKRMVRIRANYIPEDKPSRSETRIEAFDDEVLMGQLLHLPEALLREAEHPRTKPRRARVLAQVAIALEIEMHAPFRLENLVAINIKQHIKKVTINGQRRWIVKFEPWETKNHMRLVFELPTHVVKFIERACALYPQTNGFLFPGTRGSHKNDGLFSKQIKQVVERRLGTEFHLHMMRGIVATIQVTENVNGIEGARAILGDRDDKVVRKFYTKSAEKKLIRQAQETVQKVRVRTAPLVPAGSKRRAEA